MVINLQSRMKESMSVSTAKVRVLMAADRFPEVGYISRSENNFCELATRTRRTLERFGFYYNVNKED